MTAEGDDLCGATVLCASTYFVDGEFAVCVLEKDHDGIHDGHEGDHRYLWSNVR